MSNPSAIPKGCTRGKWYAGKLQSADYEEDGQEFVTIGPFEADSHYEDTICEVWGTEHDAEANAALIVSAVNELLGENK